MNRYSKIMNKNPREIVLLKAYPCAWGKCNFCDYTHDNTTNEEEMLQINDKVLSQVTGEFGVLEVINSGSCFELPMVTKFKIREVINNKKIKKLFFESHWMYRNKLEEMKEFMGVPIVFKIGIESFDTYFREEVLNKHADFKSPEEVRMFFDSPCLMVGIKGQTRDMIDKDIQILKEYFDLGTINVYINNSTNIKRDDELVDWFVNKYQYLVDDQAIEVLYNNTDFGVGD